VPLLAILALLPLAVMVYWLARVKFTNRASRPARAPRVDVVPTLQPESTR
jgi:hypothetical protein